VVIVWTPSGHVRTALRRRERLGCSPQLSPAFLACHPRSLEPAGASRPLARGKLSLDAERLEARWDGRDPGLTLTEFWIVHALARHPGHVKNRQQLMDAAR
jgi:DNA-binding response OmpR family regulator